MKLTLRIVLSLAIAAALVALLLLWSGVGPKEIIDSLGQLEAGVYWRALGVQLLIYPLRAWRFRMLIPAGRSAPFSRLLPVAAAHNMAAVLVPAKVGEAALVFYLRMKCGLPGAHGLAVLLVSRLLDLAAVAACIGVACLAIGSTGVLEGPQWLGLGVVLLVATLAFGWLSMRGERIVRAVSWLSRLTRLERTKLGEKLSGTAERLGDALRDVGEARVLSGALLSVPIWLCVFLFYAILAGGFGLELSVPEATFGSGLAILTNLLPVHGFAGFGTQEAGWVLGFTTLGVAREVAVSSGLAVHLVYLFNIVALGVLGHLVMGLLPGPTEARSTSGP